MYNLTKLKILVIGPKPQAKQQSSINSPRNPMCLRHPTDPPIPSGSSNIKLRSITDWFDLVLGRLRYALNFQGNIKNDRVWPEL